MLPKGDLQAYAFEGIVTALNKADLSNDKVFGYVYRYAIVHCLKGALQMLGIKRYRSQKRQKRIAQIQVAYDPNKLNTYIEENQEPTFDRYETVKHVFDAQEIEWILQMLDHSVEKLVLEHVLQSKTVKEISEALHITPRKIRRYIINLKTIWYKAIQGKSIESLLTPYEYTWLPIKVSRLNYRKIDFKLHASARTHGCRITQLLYCRPIKTKKK